MILTDCGDSMLCLQILGEIMCHTNTLPARGLEGSNSGLGALLQDQQVAIKQGHLLPQNQACVVTMDLHQRRYTQK